MSIATIGAACGVLAFLGGFTLWAIRIVARVTMLLDSVKELKRKDNELQERVKNFKDEFQEYFLKCEIEDRARARRLEKRLDKLERGLIAYIAKNQGTLPDIGE